MANRADEVDPPATPPILILDRDARSSDHLGLILSDRGWETSRVGTSVDAQMLMRKRDFELLIHRRSDTDEDLDPLYQDARNRGIPVLLVTDDVTSLPPELIDQGPIAKADDWLDARSVESELPHRAGKLLASRRARREADPSGGREPTSRIQLDAEFFAIVIHDLRTPLNVMYLSELMIRQSIPPGNPDTDEDLKALDENCRQMERMLSQLTEFFRLFETNLQLAPALFSPKRLVEEVIEGRTNKPDPRQGPVFVEIDPSCPAEVTLDPLRARVALQYAIANAASSSAGKPVRLLLKGGDGRWVTTLTIDHPPPQQVKSVTLNSRSFTRLCGFAADRRGMDLAIVARVSELIGGSARLDVVEQKGSTIVIDWPVEMATA